ncbi:MAG: DUF58 domain-containing protein [Candidatus Riflebacteria bacterium]|nr:DUF58 domain-containing protein [Candidatus Riflebacteria bacterium]
MLSKELLKEVGRIEIRTRQLVDSLYSGSYKSVFKGHGMEFAGIRQYYRGDDFRSIDWKVSARSGDLHIREHTEERELQVIIALDLSGSMAFGSGSKEKRESAVEFAAVMSLAAERNNDRAGICLFTDRVEKYVPPAKGKSHVLRLIRDLSFFIPQNKGTNLSAPLDFLNSTLRRRSVIFLVSDGINAGSIERQLKVTAAKHDLIIVNVRDPREKVIPDIGMIEVANPETGEEFILDTSSHKVVDELLKAQKKQDEQLEKICRNTGVDLIQLVAGESVAKPVVKLFAQREAGRR